MTLRKVAFDERLSMAVETLNSILKWFREETMLQLYNR